MLNLLKVVKVGILKEKLWIVKVGVVKVCERGKLVRVWPSVERAAEAISWIGALCGNTRLTNLTLYDHDDDGDDVQKRIQRYLCSFICTFPGKSVIYLIIKILDTKIFLIWCLENLKKNHPILVKTWTPFKGVDEEK